MQPGDLSCRIPLVLDVCHAAGQHGRHILQRASVFAPLAGVVQIAVGDCIRQGTALRPKLLQEAQCRRDLQSTQPGQLPQHHIAGEGAAGQLQSHRLVGQEGLPQHQLIPGIPRLRQHASGQGGVPLPHQKGSFVAGNNHRRHGNIRPLVADLLCDPLMLRPVGFPCPRRLEQGGMHAPVLRLVGKPPLLLQIVHHFSAAAGFKGAVDGILRTAEHDPVENLILRLPAHANGLAAEDDADAGVPDLLEQRQ